MSHFCFRTAQLLQISSLPFKLILQTGFDWIDLALLCLEQTSLLVPVGVRNVTEGNPSCSTSVWLITSLSELTVLHSDPCDLCNYCFYVRNTVHLGGITVESGDRMAEREQVGNTSLKIIFVCGRMLYRSLVQQEQASFYF